MASSSADRVINFPLAVRAGVEAESARDGSALEQDVLSLYDQSQTGLLRYLYSIGLPDSDAEETVQEVFLALFQHLRRGRARTNLRGWVYRVAHNLGLKRRSAARRTVLGGCEDIFERQVDPCPTPEEQVTARERREGLLAVFHALPEQDRCCLHLRSEGLRYREIAEALGISLGSVANSVTRALDRLQRADGRL